MTRIHSLLTTIYGNIYPAFKYLFNSSSRGVNLLIFDNWNRSKKIYICTLLFCIVRSIYIFKINYLYLLQFISGHICIMYIWLYVWYVSTFDNVLQMSVSSVVERQSGSYRVFGVCRGTNWWSQVQSLYGLAF